MVEARHRTIAEDVEQRQTQLAQEHHALHLKRAKQVAKAWPEAALEHRAKAEAAKAREGYSGKASANAAMRTLRAIYNYAADRDDTLPRNPVRLKRQWHRVAPRERNIKPDEMPAFYKAVTALANPIGRDYLLLVLFTGLRRSEAAGLRWDDIDLKAKTLSIPAARTKAKRKLDLPLTDFVYDSPGGAAEHRPHQIHLLCRQPVRASGGAALLPRSGGGRAAASGCRCMICGAPICTVADLRYLRLRPEGAGEPRPRQGRNERLRPADR